MRKRTKVGLAILFGCVALAMVPRLLWEGMRVCLGVTVAGIEADFPDEIHALRRHAEAVSEPGPSSEAALVYRDASEIFEDPRIELVCFSGPSDRNSRNLLKDARNNLDGWSLGTPLSSLEPGDDVVRLWRGNGRWLAEYRFSPGPPAPPGFVYEMWVSLGAPDDPGRERIRAVLVTPAAEDG